MQDGTTDTMHVTFPAIERFSRIGRVAIAGLTFRLGLDVQRVENLRQAVDEVVTFLINTRPTEHATIAIGASWSPGHLKIELSNEAPSPDPVQGAELLERLHGLVDQAAIRDHGIELQLHDTE